MKYLKKQWERVPKYVKVTLSALVIIVFFVATIMGAMATSFELDKKYSLTRGEQVEDSIVVYDIPFGAEASASSTGSLLTITDEERTGDMLIISYTIDIPKNTLIDRYKETISVTVDDETLQSVVTINVQNEMVSTLAAFFSNHIIKLSALMLLLVVVGVYLGISYNKTMRRKMHKRGIVVMVILVALIIGLFFLITESNAFVKQAGSSFTQSIRITEYKNQIGSLQIVRNPDTPVASDWITFSGRNDSFLFFTIKNREEKSFDMTVNLPTTVESGVYKYDVKVAYLGDEPEIVTKKFRVR